MLDRIQTRHYLMVLTVFAFVVGQSNCAKKSKISAKKNVVQAASVQLSEPSLKLNRGDSKEVSAKAFRDTGVEALIGPRGEEILFAWSGCDPNIATVTATGAKAVITGAGEGKCTVQVDSSGYNPARLEIEVSPAVPTSIQISPSEATVARDAEIALTVAAVYSDGSNKDISDAVTWEGIPSGVIDFRQGSRIVGISIGSATAKATYAGISAEISVFVKDPELKSIVILTSGQPSYIGAGLQFSALGVYEDGSTADLTSQVDWISSDSTKVSFSDSALKGFALLKASGVGQITAQLGTQTATRQITVNGASLNDIVIAPRSSQVAAGYKQQLVATGTYSDGTKLDLTSAATWVSSDASKVTIVDSGSQKGLVSGVAAGSATVTATVLGLSDSVLVNVSSATLSTIQISPASKVMPAGTASQFAAQGVFSDSSKLDLTHQLSWTSSDSAVVVGDAIGNKGLVQAIAAGSATVTAASGMMTGQSSVTVHGSAVTSLTMDRASLTLAPNEQRNLRVTATFADNSTADVTGSVVWSSADVTKAAVSNAAGTKGLVVGIAAGATTVEAALDSVTVSIPINVSGTANPELVSLFVTPSTTAVSQVATVQYSVLEGFSNGQIQMGSSGITWSSSDSAIASIDANGLLTAHSNGIVTISASKSGVTGNAQATITLDRAAPPVPTGLSATALSSTSMKFDWASGGGTTAGYRLAYASGSSAPANCNAGTTLITAGPTATITSLSPGTSYSGIVCAMNADNPADLSTATAGVTGWTMPAAPTGFAAVVISEFQVNLTWTAKSGDTGGYKIAYMSGGAAPSDCNAGTVVIAGSNATSYNVTSLNAATTYKFVVCTINSVSGSSEPSAVVTATTEAAPTAPTNFVATASTSDTIGLSWDDMAVDSGGYKIAYQIGGSAPANCNSGTTTTALQNVTTKNITGLSYGTQYSFVICSVSGSAAISSPSAATSAITKPPTPTNFVASSRTSSQINLTWDDMNADGLGYQIAYLQGASGPANCAAGSTTTTAANVSTKSITSLAAATQYTFIICTRDALSGDSIASAPLSVYTRPDLPTNPTGLIVSATQIDISWDDMSGDTGGYKIAYQTGASAPADCASGTTTTTAQNVASKSITGLAAGTQYSFVLCTVSSVAGDSVPSATLTSYTRPAAPVISNGGAAMTQITISWSGITGANDGYKIAYTTGATAPVACNTGSVVTSAAGTTSKAITGLSASTQYSFIACAINTQSGQSVGSNALTISTTASVTSPVTAENSTVTVSTVQDCHLNNPNNASVNDNTYGVGSCAGWDVTDVLDFKSFNNGNGLGIPSGATIQGIVVQCNWYFSRDYVAPSVRLLKGGVVAGDNKGSTSSILPLSAEATTTYGGAADLWGTTWTPNEINATNFGVRIGLESDDAGGATINWDSCSVTVHFTGG